MGAIIPAIIPNIPLLAQSLRGAGAAGFGNKPKISGVVPTITNGAANAASAITSAKTYTAYDTTNLRLRDQFRFYYGYPTQVSAGSTNVAAFGSETGGSTAQTVLGIQITAGGTGATDGDPITFTGGAGTGATGIVRATGGVVTNVIITNPATTNYTSTPTLVQGGTGTGLTGTVLMGAGTVCTKPLGVELMHYGKQIEFTLQSSAGNTPFYRVWVDGTEVTLGTVATGIPACAVGVTLTSTQKTNILLDFGTSQAMRRIKFAFECVGNGMYFNGINTGPTDLIMYPDTPSPQVLFCETDSIGANQGGTNRLLSWVYQMGDIMGMNPYLNGAGGTGYLNPATSRGVFGDCVAPPNGYAIYATGY